MTTIERMKNMEQLLAIHHTRQIPTDFKPAAITMQLMDTMTSVELDYLFRHTKLPGGVLLNPKFGEYVKLQPHTHIVHIIIRGASLWRDTTPLVDILKGLNCARGTVRYNNTYNFAKNTMANDNYLSSDDVTYLFSLINWPDAWRQIDRGVLMEMIDNPNNLSLGAHIEIMNVLDDDCEYRFNGDTTTILYHLPTNEHLEKYPYIFNNTYSSIVRKHLIKLICLDAYKKEFYITRTLLDHIWLKDITSEILHSMHTEVFLDELLTQIQELPYEPTQWFKGNFKELDHIPWLTKLLEMNTEKSKAVLQIIDDYAPEVMENFYEQTL